MYGSLWQDGTGQDLVGGESRPFTHTHIAVPRAHLPVQWKTLKLSALQHMLDSPTVAKISAIICLYLHRLLRHKPEA